MNPITGKIGTYIFSLGPEYPSGPEKKFHHIEYNGETKRDVDAHQLEASLEFN